MKAFLLGPHGAIVICLLGWLGLELPAALAAVRDLIKRRPMYPGGQMYLPWPAVCAPRRIAWRHVLRPHRPRGPHMPDESEIRRYGRADYGPRHIDPGPRTPPDNGGQARTRPDRRGLVAGGLAFLITLLVAAGIAGAYFLGHHGSASSAPKATNVAASPSSTYDAATIQACKSAGIVRRRSLVPDPEAKAARAVAASSDQQALREIAQKYDHPEAFGKPIDDVYALTAATEIEGWCLWHKLDTAN